MDCPICGSAKLKSREAQTQEIKGGSRRTVLRCQECAILFDPEFKQDRSALYDENYGAWGGERENQAVARSKKIAFEKQLKSALKYMKPRGAKLLDLGTANGYLLEVAAGMDFEVYGTEISPRSLEIAKLKFPGKIFEGPLEEQKFENDFFDVITMTDVLEHLNNPAKTMEEIGRILKPGGWLLIISPNTASWTSYVLGKKWFQYKYEHLFYFNRRSLSRILENHNFQLKLFQNNHKRFSLEYYQAYFQKYSFGILGRIFLKIYPHLPRIIQQMSFTNPITGEFLALAQKNEKNN